MQIIPVIDIRGGIVVHARGGNRDAYSALNSVLTRSTDVFQVVNDILNWYPFEQFYIADLDAIEAAKHRPEFYAELVQCFTGTQFWLDAGITSQKDLRLYSKLHNLKIVIGSETLKSSSLLEIEGARQSMILSLDRRGKQLLGDHNLLHRTELWTEKTIVMDLDVVGANQGPSLEWLQALIAQRPDIEWYAAGGVRNKADLEQLQKIRAAGTLVASALHTGQIDKAELQKIEQVHRPF
ncbi:HisA/HisF-related TIM barrel protein [Methylophaga thiooxydans]|uniref:HisA/HisF-related TIM barrel protein n=1 Tax=Methylophaga thiooxydans TaxID=392484 RepID=UPI002355F2B7|nr:HisA/HisF-related TIM barrel protein [Methylophaga thiooxydans]